MWRFGHAIYRLRWLIIAVWACALLAATPVAPRIAKVLQPGGFSTRDLESLRAAATIQRELGANPAGVLVVFRDESRPNTSREYQTAVDRAVAAVRDLPFVSTVRAPGENPRLIAPDGKTAYASIGLRAVPDQFRSILPLIQSAVDSSELSVTLTGAPIFFDDIQHVTEQDLRRAELISFPFAALALLLVFGSIVAALLPAMVGGAAVLVTLGVVVVLTNVTEVSIFALNLVSMLGLGLGIDYALFIVSRFRQELPRRDVVDALAASMATAGRAVLFSGVTVFIGLLGLIQFDFMALRSLGIAGSIVVAASVAASLTLLPATLAILGHRVDALPIPRPRIWGGGLWGWVSERVHQHAVLTLLVVVTILVTLGVPFLRVQFGAPDASILPTSVQSRIGFDRLREGFGEGEVSPILVAVMDEESIWKPEKLDAIQDLVLRLQQDERVSRVDSIVSIDPRITPEQHRLLLRDGRDVKEPYARALVDELARERFTLLRVVARQGQTSEEAKGLVRSIRATPIGAGLRFEVGGGAAAVVDYADRLYSEFPRTLLFVVTSTYLVLLVLLRSVVLPLKALVMNTLSLLASYGALVVVFQDGWLAGPLAFTPLGFIEASLPIIMFCLLFGLSMDYEVFLLSRVKEAYDSGLNNAASVAAGLRQSGTLITGAASIVVLVSMSFVAADVILIKALGLGTAIAVFLDATVVRALLVPATMSLLGDWNWWAPRAVLRLLPATRGHA
ncbi:MAG: MMPL family transporter [Chloroflexota bacterium]